METSSDTTREMLGAGLLILLGIVVAVFATTYNVGSLTRMGAGYVPLALGVLLIVVGVLIAATTRRGAATTSAIDPSLPVPPTHAGWAGFQWRGWGCILAGVAAFVILGRWGGLVPATFFAVFISALGDRENSVRDAALLALGITVAGVLIFSYALKLVFPLFTWG